MLTNGRYQSINYFFTARLVLCLLRMVSCRYISHSLRLLPKLLYILYKNRSNLGLTLVLFMVRIWLRLD